jgi:hypothetical protein
MSNTKALLTFKNLNPSEKITFGNGTIAALTAAGLLPINPFANLLITVAELKSLNDALAAAANGMLNGGKAASNALKDAVKQWNAGMTTAANGVSDAAQNVSSVIIAGGFNPSKNSRSPKPTPGQITDYTVYGTGKNGNIIINTKTGAPNASSYVTAVVPPGVAINFQQNTMIITVNGVSVYIAAHTTRELEIYNLPTLIVYTAKTYGCNTKGSGPAASGQVIPT